MFRTQVYLTQIEKEKLSQLSRKLGKNQSALIREAIDQFIEMKSIEKINKITILQEISGIWAERNDLPDFNALRREWDRYHD